MWNKKAFTLLEVLLAMVLLATGILLLSNSWSAAFARVNKTQVNFEMAELLERKMSEYERKYKGKPLSEIPEKEEDDFGEQYPQYTWKMQSKDLEFPDLSALLLAQKDGGVDPMTETVVKKMTEVLSKAVKEVKITIIYSGSKRKIESSVTNYFVDLEKDISIGI